MKVAIVHGPNLNLLGSREPEVYGRATLEDINNALVELGRSLNTEIDTYQSNNEGELVDHVQKVAPDVDGFVINAGAYTHTSIALRDALLSVSRPFVEVHLSNVFSREDFRHRSFLADRALGSVVGFGVQSYLLGLEGLVGHLRPTTAG